MYPSTSLFIAFGQLVIVVLVLFSYPLQVHPCRNSLDKVFHAGELHKPSDGEINDPDHVDVEMTVFKHTLLTLAIIVSSFTIAYFVDDLKLGTFLISIASKPELFKYSPLLDRLVPQRFHSFSLGYSIGRYEHTIYTQSLRILTFLELSRNDAAAKGLNLAAFALMVYGICIFIFW